MLARLPLPDRGAVALTVRCRWGRYTTRFSLAHDAVQAAAKGRDPARFLSDPGCLGRRHGNADSPVLPRSVRVEPGHRSRALWLGGVVARRLLSRRKDRLHRQPDGSYGRRLRAAGRWPPADVAA